MTKLIVATNNAHKVREIFEILGDFFPEMVSLKQAGLDIDVEEDGETFAQNAVKKAEEVTRLTGLPALADDSGIEVEALGGDPGVYSARYAGRHGNDAGNNRKLLAMAAGLPYHRRKADFRAAIALSRPGRPTLVTEGVVWGRLAWGLHGDGGFGYDPLFIPEGYEQTFGELPAEVKHSMSHRGNALRAMVKLLEAERG